VDQFPFLFVSWFGSRGRLPLPMVIWGVLALVESPDMNIKHPSQELLIFERIACKIESDFGAN
jgi:hypothetical protein